MQCEDDSTNPLSASASCDSTLQAGLLSGDLKAVSATVKGRVSPFDKFASFSGRRPGAAAVAGKGGLNGGGAHEGHHTHDDVGAGRCIACDGHANNANVSMAAQAAVAGAPTELAAVAAVTGRFSSQSGPPEALLG